MLLDFDRADRIGEFWGYPESRSFAELLIDCEEDRTLRAVLVGMVRGGDEFPGRCTGSIAGRPSRARSRPGRASRRAAPSCEDAAVDAPDTHYVLTPDGVYLAYQAVGEGPIDIAVQIDWPGNIDMQWEFPVMRALLTQLATFSRVILHDHRGIGLSSRDVPIPTLETRVSDLGLVLDALGADHPTLVGFAASGAVNALFAATRPERTGALAWLDPVSRYRWAPDNPWGRPQEELEAELRDLELWGTDAYGRAFAEYEAAVGNPIPEEDAAVLARATRNACTPDVARELSVMWTETDVRDILATIKVPTLLLSHVDLGERDRAGDVAARIPGAELVEIRGLGYSPQTMETAAEHIRRFIGVARPPSDLDTVLATVLFTDIVESTERAAALGDRRWAELVERHHERVRAALERWHGTERDTAGDGFYATFEGPWRGRSSSAWGNVG